MAGLRQLIASTILRILSDGKARKARDLAPLLQCELNRSDIEKSDINSVLYRDLGSEVKCNSSFEWQIVKSPKAPPVTVQPPTEQATQNAESKPDMLRTVQRLRSGLPPCEHVESLTVGSTKLVQSLKGMLAGQNGAPSWAIVRGDYGAGKSHALALYTDLALREGYAVCHLSADGLNNALNHPQRFISSLFSTLELPLRPIYGYTDVLHDLLTDRDLAMRTRDVTSQYLDGWSSMAIESRDFLDRISRSLASSDDHSDIWRESVRMVTSHLTGDSIRHLPASSPNRQTAYRLLMIARDLILELGMKGIAIGIDEVESIYTKLPTSRSRSGAFRVLSALCNIPKLRVVLAITPDAQRQLRDDIPTMLYDSPQCLDVEDIVKWSTSLSDGAVPLFDCRQLGPNEREELLSRISKLYGSVYGTDLSTKRFTNEWDLVLGRARATPIPTRILVRQAVDHLDGFRYRQNGIGPHVKITSA